MTLEVAGHWVAVRVDQLDRIAHAEAVWPVPFAELGYRGVLDTGDSLIPVLHLSQGESISPDTHPTAALAAILHVRGESVALAIDKPGRVLGNYRFVEDDVQRPTPLNAMGARRGRAGDIDFWLIDTDRLWQRSSASPTDALQL